MPLSLKGKKENIRKLMSKLLEFWDDDRCMEAFYNLDKWSEADYKRLSGCNNYDSNATLSSNINGCFTWSSSPDNPHFWSKLCNHTRETNRD